MVYTNPFQRCKGQSQNSLICHTIDHHSKHISICPDSKSIIDRSQITKTSNCTPPPTDPPLSTPDAHAADKLFSPHPVSILICRKFYLDYLLKLSFISSAIIKSLIFLFVFFSMYVRHVNKRYLLVYNVIYVIS